MLFQSFSDDSPVRPGAEHAELPVDFHGTRDARYDIERLMLITEALWDMLREQHGYQEDELLRRVAEIDMRDGSLDGCVHAHKPHNCPDCGRTLARKRSNCIYCGAFVPPDPFER